MDSKQLLERFRLDSRDTGTENLWSDEEVYSYLDDAQKMFCRLTGGLADATSTVARLKAKAGNPFAALSPLVLKVRAVFGVEGRKVDLLNFEDLEFSPNDGKVLFADIPGQVRSVVLGMEPGKVRVIHTPEEDQTLNMIVYRLPLDAIDGPGQELEVDEQHHLALLKWAMHLAHRKQDAEAYDRGRSDQFEREFRQYCAIASEEKSRREHKHRTVAFQW
jgi:hypothetical protein